MFAQGALAAPALADPPFVGSSADGVPAADPRRSFSEPATLEETPQAGIDRGFHNADLRVRVPHPHANADDPRYEHIGLNVSSPEEAAAALQELPALAQGRRIRVIWVDPHSKTDPQIVRYLRTVAPENSELQIVNYNSQDLDRQHVEADARLEAESLPVSDLSAAEQSALKQIGKQSNSRTVRLLRRWQQSVTNFGTRISQVFRTTDTTKLNRYGSRLGASKAGALLAVWLYTKFDVAEGWSVMSVAGLAAVSAAGLQYLFTKHAEDWVRIRANLRLPVIITRTDVPWWNAFAWSKRIAARGFSAFNANPWLKAMVIDPVVRGSIGVYMRYLAYAADPLNTQSPWSKEFAKSWITANADLPIASGFDMKWSSLYERGAISRSMQFWGYQMAGLVGFIKGTVTDLGFSAHPLGWVTIKSLATLDLALKGGVIAAHHFLPPISRRAKQLTGLVPSPVGDEVQVVIMSGEAGPTDQRSIAVLNGLRGVDVNTSVTNSDGTKSRYVDLDLLKKVVQANATISPEPSRLQQLMLSIRRRLKAAFQPLDQRIKRGCAWIFSGTR